MTNYTKDVVIEAGETINVVWYDPRLGPRPEGQGNIGYYLSATELFGPAPVFRNFGHVEFVTSAPGAELILLYPNYSSSFFNNVTWENHGDLIVRALNGEARGFWGFSWSPDFLNTGRLIVEGPTYALGFISYDGTTPVLTNSGEMTTRSAGTSETVFFGNYGIIRNSGLVQSYSSSDVWNARAIQLLSGGRVENSGSIVATDSVGSIRSHGVELLQGGVLDLINGGSISAEDAVIVNARAPLGRANIVNTGQINGDVVLRDGNDSVRNQGVIRGEIGLGGGADTYDGRDGVAGGMVSGGDGNDSLLGGSGFDNFQGNTGDDTEAGGAGDDWVVGGKENDLLSGDAGADLVYGNIGNDTCNGGDGDDIVRGGQDNDSITGGAGNDYVSGDRGSDTVSGGAGADLFHTFGDAGVDRVLDFNLAEGDRVQVDPGTQYTVAQAGADTVISMTGGGQMTLVGIQMSTLTAGWIFGA